LGLGVALLAFAGPAAPRTATRSGRRALARHSGEPAWLNEINYWRKAAGLQPVADQPAWDLGIKHHLTYLEKTPARYLTGQYASAHTENPASPYYTTDGAQEAASSDLAEGAACTTTEALDIWLAAPFHAVGILRAQLTQVALAVEPRKCYAGLDVIRGLDYSQPAASTPIIYPGPGSTTDLLTFGGEEPDPTQTCGWQGKQVGLPLVVLLPQAPAQSVTASLKGPTGTESTGNRHLCVVDESTYHSSDPVYGPTGAEILKDDNAVFLIPRNPLRDGSYSAMLQQPGEADISWSFSARATSAQHTGESHKGTVTLGHRKSPVKLTATAAPKERFRYSLQSPAELRFALLNSHSKRVGHSFQTARRRSGSFELGRLIGSRKLPQGRYTLAVHQGRDLLRQLDCVLVVS
jgi:hypothetical protein